MALYLISGGPGAGKTTLLAALRQAGFAGCDEVSRQLIQEQVALGSSLVPWHDLGGFAELARGRMVAQYTAASQSGGITFFDRGLPDLIAYLTAAGLPVAPAYYRAVADYSYQRLAFLAPPWPEIYVNDPERWHTPAEAAALYQTLHQTYEALGFMVRVLPRASVAERVAFVQAALGASDGAGLDRATFIAEQG
jgi:predicted ATPase